MWNHITGCNMKYYDVLMMEEYLETKIYQKDTDALTILGLLYFYGVGLEMDKPKGKKMINEAVQKGNTAASWIIKDIYKNTN